MLQGGEKCACEILEKMRIAQPTLSHHMKILVDSGIVKAIKEGKWTYYSLSEAGVQHASKLLEELTKSAIDIGYDKSKTLLPNDNDTENTGDYDNRFKGGCCG